MRELTIATVMTRDPVTVAPGTGAREIAHVLAAHGLETVPVVRGDGVPVGVICGADLQPERRAADLMSIPVLSVGPGEPVSAAARQLSRSGVRRLYVIELGRLVGVVTRRDLLKVFLRSDEDIQADIEREVRLWAGPAAVTVSVNRGVVTLNGQLGRRSEVEIANRLTTTVRGVVEVRNRLHYAWDDPVR